MGELLDLLMFAMACVFLMMGFPVAFTLAGTALIFAGIGWAFGVFDMSFIGFMPQRIFGNAIWNEVLLAVPLFVFMGVMLERSKVAEELLETMGKLFGAMRGGIGVSVTVVGALLAASTGIVGATVVTMGLLSLPTMLRRNYSPSLACGSICAAGTLGQIIPPSIVLVILGDQISNAYVDAQREAGNWSPEPVSVGDLFAGALLPGLMLVGMYLTYQLFMAWWKPETSPAIPAEELRDGADDLGSRVVHALLPPVILIIAVLGSILAGVATPTEAAAVGAMGATLLAGLRVRELNMDYVMLTEKPVQFGSLSRIAGAALIGFVGGMLVANELLGGADSALVGGVVGAAVLAVLTRAGGVRGLLAMLDSRGNGPIYAAALSLVFMLILSNYVDLRIRRDEISGSDMAFTLLAAAATLVVVWGVLVAGWRVWAAGILRLVNRGTMEISAMVFTILIGAAMFSLVFRGLGGDDAVHAFLTQLPGGTYTAIIIVMLVMFFLGFFLDFIEITFVVVPIVAPVLLANDYISPVWLGVLMAMNLQTSFLTPPFGFALFYLRGVAPDTVKTMDIYRGVAPFVGIQVVALLVLGFFPILANWLPEVIFGTSFVS
ncbi:MAG: TRAP transporter large permease subunit [Alphaproteobacteria bacterium]|nr:TRAP transporter large permease subunit [Alphaproteobacteria bacterium]